MSESVDLGRSSARRQFALWLMIAGILFAGIAFSWDPTPLAQGLAAIFIACALLHAALSYGAGTALLFFVACIAITFAVENVGAATGFPFGHYHFEVGAELPRVGRIPIIVGPLWFGGGYFSFAVASTLLDGADRKLDQPSYAIALPLVAAFVMTQWDLVFDAPSATISKAWIWHDGGAVFGVPLSNYLGWLLTSWLFFQAFALILRRRQNSDGPVGPNRKLQLIAILFYLSAGLTHVVPYLMGQSGEAFDGAGHLWRTQDVREATVAIFVFTMLFTALLATLRLWTQRSEPANPKT